MSSTINDKWLHINELMIMIISCGQSTDFDGI